MQRTPRRKPARAASGARRTRRPAPPQVERLEDRAVPSVFRTWDPASQTLQVTATQNEDLAITLFNLAGVEFVMVDGGFSGVSADSVKTLQLIDTGAGPAGSKFDVSQVLPATFTALGDVGVTGNGAGSTLVCATRSLTWDVTGADAGTVTGTGAPLVQFSSVGSLQGGGTADDFAFHTGGTLSAHVTGGAGTETLDFSPDNNDVTVTLGGYGPKGFSGTATGYLAGFSGVDSLVGGNGTNTLVGENLASSATSTWSLSDTESYNDGTATLNFTGFGTLKGGSGQNTFDVLGNAADLYQVTADLYGGPDTNTFSLQGGVDLQGTIHGGTGTNILDDTQFGSGLGVVLTGYDTAGYSGTQTDTTFHDVNEINVAPGLGWTLVGDNNPSHWSLPADSYSSDSNPALTFSGFDNLNGGDGGNTFNVDASAAVNLIGGAGNDTFAMSPGAVLTGSITDTSGNGTISYAAYSNSVSVDLTAGTAPNVSGAVTVNNVIGGSGDDTLKGGSGTNILFAGSGHDSLIGGSGNETYSLLPGGGSSDVIQPNGSTNTLSYSRSSSPITIDVASQAVQTVCPGATVQFDGPIQNFVGGNYGDTFKITTGVVTANLTGGPGADTFVFTPGATLNGSIDGGLGHNTLDYSAYSTPVQVNLAAGTATAVTGRVTNVDDAIGPSGGGNNLIGDEITSVAFNTTTPHTNDVLTATVTATDLNNDPLTFTYVWKVNGKVVKTTTGTASTSDTLTLGFPGYGARGNVIVVTVTPYDTNLPGKPATSAPATVQDSPPFITSVSLTPSRPVPGQVLSAAAAGQDPDGRPITFAYQWLLNGHPIAGATGPTLNLSQHGYGVVGDTVTVRVTPSDGTLTGTTVGGATTLVASPAATFVIGTNHEIYAVNMDAVGNPTGGYYLVSSVPVRSVATDTDALGRTELFVLGMDDQVWAMHLDGNGVAMTDWFGGTCFLTAPGQVKAISATRTAAGNPEVFVIGTDNRVHAELFNAQGYGSGGYFLTAPGSVTGISATQDASRNPLVFVIGSQSQVYAEDFDAAGRTTHGYFLVDAGPVKAINAGSYVPNHPLLLAITPDGQVEGRVLNGNGTANGGWYALDSGPAVSVNWTFTGSGNLDVFTLGRDGRMKWATLNLTDSLGVHGPVVIPGVINDVANDGNLTGLTPLAVDLAFVLSPPTPAPDPPKRGRRSGP